MDRADHGYPGEFLGAEDVDEPGGSPADAGLTADSEASSAAELADSTEHLAPEHGWLPL
jgi:hypothetical protein